MTTRLFTDVRCLDHDAGAAHPESPARLRAILEVLERAPITGLERHTARLATRDELATVHSPALLDQLLALEGKSAVIDEDTMTSEGSLRAALLAAGASVQAVDEVWRGVASNAFVVVRPPGHHAEPNRAMGFCLFNNVAVAAEAARAAGAERVAIVDWDVHHGNGTQAAFYERADVLFTSVHQYPFYPGTGAPTETGEGEGKGLTVNCGLPPGQRDADYGAVFDELFLPALERFKPQLILVSAGFDPHAHDPLGEMALTERGFAAMCQAVKSSAERLCGGRLVLLLEGGYDLNGLSQSVHACAEVLAGQRRESFPSGVSVAAADSIEATKAALRGVS